MIKAVFMDVDNTMTDPATRRIPDHTREAIRLARENGVLVFAATGRFTLGGAEFKALSDIELDGYVGLNGQICHLRDKPPFYSILLDKDDTGAVFRMREEMGFNMTVIEESGRMYLTGTDDAVREYAGLVDIELPPLIPEGYKPGGVYTLSPFVDEKTSDAILARLKNTAAVRWYSSGCDLIPAGGGKHVGVEKMLLHFGIDRRDSMAIGDGGNDISMLVYAGTGVAMAHAGDSVKQAADDVAPAHEPIMEIFKKYGVIR